MPNRCVAGHCSNLPNVEQGIVLHAFPFYGDERPTARRRRRQWVEFVKAKRARWEPTATSRLCSAHFKPEDFMRRFHNIEGQGQAVIPRLIRDEIGVVPVPTVHATPTNSNDDRPDACSGLSSAQRRRRNRQLVRDAFENSRQSGGSATAAGDEAEHIPSESETTFYDPAVLDENLLLAAGSSAGDIIEGFENDEELFKDSCCQTTEHCTGCEYLKEDNRRLKNKVITLRARLNIQRNTARKFIFRKKRKLNPCTHFEEEPSDSADETDETEELSLLFKFCFVCKSDNPLVVTRQKGTMVEVKATCCNMSCGYQHRWCSQPYRKDSKMPAGNLLLSMATLFAGGSISKVITIFKHMGLGCVSFTTFFTIQRTKLFPTIYLFWQRYQKKLFDQIIGSNSAIVISGDGRHDSMGHSAKYGAYSIFCNTHPGVLHFEMIQRNEAGSSTGMELLGFQKAMEYLNRSGLNISTFISDRHGSIAKSMRDDYKNIKHYFDLWHLKKTYIGEMFKVLEESADDIFKNAAETLKGLTPAPMNRMLERMAKERAIQKHEARKIMKTIDVPATGADAKLQSNGKAVCMHLQYRP
eukprot:Seg84.2 transcript_id=Seg84.2/GoldUCD/mRNA.D3Y31 product="hypothetical protein" protein_id=Seg84.2/GoldUCD/D3Y31